MEYLDIELEIGPGTGREYPVAVLRSPAGEARGSMRFPFDELALKAHLLALENALLRSGGTRRQVLSREEEEVQQFGRCLFEALLTGPLRSRYDVSLQQAVAQDKGLRLKLRIQAPEMAALPWEYLYNPDHAEYLSLSDQTPLVRYLELPQPIQPLEVAPPLRILGMIASPKDLDPLNVKNETARMEEALTPARTKGLVNLVWLEGDTWRDVQRTMRSGPWHVFHFIGHGGFDPNSDEGLIAFCDEAGRSHRLTATQVGRLLADHRPLRLTLLNACLGARGSKQDLFSSTAAILVRRGIPAVLAMQYEITDRAAIEFSRTFYEALAEGSPVDMAVAEGRKAISLEVANTVEWGTPVLYMRSPDGILFNLMRSTAAPPEAEEVRPPPAILLETGAPPVEEKRKPVPQQGEAPTSDIFLSYAHEDQNRVLPLITALKALGWSVFWDQTIPAWMTPRHVISREIQNCRAVLVVWSQRSVKLTYVQEEAERGNARNILLPLLLDAVDIPLGFRNRQTADLTHWDGSPEAPVFRRLVRAILQIPGMPKPRDARPPEPGEQGPTGAERVPESITGHDVAEMVLVPAGEFWMGREHAKAYYDERPRHQVALNDFYIDKYPVTNAQYGRFLKKAWLHLEPAHWTMKEYNQPDQPVVGVNWEDAQAYCRWAGKRLPTEAEWEKAARGPDGRRYPWGNEWDPTRANTAEGEPRKPTPVGSYPTGASPYGAYDMAGNVWEWTSSLYKAYPYKADDGREDPRASGDRVLRGGAWNNAAELTRASARLRYDPECRHNDIGFRCAKTP